MKRKFGQIQMVVSAHLDKTNKFPPLMMHNSESIIIFASTAPNLVGFFKSPYYSADLKGVSLLNQALCNSTENEAVLGEVQSRLGPPYFTTFQGIVERLHSNLLSTNVESSVTEKTQRS